VFIDRAGSINRRARRRRYLAFRERLYLHRLCAACSRRVDDEARRRLARKRWRLHPGVSSRHWSLSFHGDVCRILLSRYAFARFYSLLIFVTLAYLRVREIQRICKGHCGCCHIAEAMYTLLSQLSELRASKTRHNGANLSLLIVAISFRKHRSIMCMSNTHVESKIDRHLYTHTHTHTHTHTKRWKTFPKCGPPQPLIESDTANANNHQSSPVYVRSYLIVTRMSASKLTPERFLCVGLVLVLALGRY